VQCGSHDLAVAAELPFRVVVALLADFASRRDAVVEMFDRLAQVADEFGDTDMVAECRKQAAIARRFDGQRLLAEGGMEAFADKWDQLEECDELGRKLAGLPPSPPPPPGLRRAWTQKRAELRNGHKRIPTRRESPPAPQVSPSLARRPRPRSARRQAARRASGPRSGSDPGGDEPPPGDDEPPPLPSRRLSSRRAIDLCIADRVQALARLVGGAS
jgi:hypothetical protein